MYFRMLTALGLAAIALLYSNASMAHHSFAMFDADKTIEIEVTPDGDG